MKKITTLFACCLLLLTQATAQQALLSPGSLAIVALRTDYTEADAKQILTVLALDNIQPNTTITFTDRPWRSMDGFIAAHGSDGFFEWTATGSSIPKGTVITFEATLNMNPGPDPNNPLPPRVDAIVMAKVGTTVRGTCSVPNDFFWGANALQSTSNPDQIIAFTGTFANPGLLWAFSTSNWEYNADRHPHTSDLPKALRDANCFVELGSASNPVDNAYFANGTTSRSELILGGTKEAYYTLFPNKNLYFKSDNYVNFPAYSLKVTNGQESLLGTPLSEWSFDGTINNNNGEYPIRTQHVDIGLSNPSVGYLYTSNYPSTYTSHTNSGGLIFTGSTLGYRNIYFAFKRVVSQGGANSCQLEYSINNGAWNSVSLNANAVSFFDVTLQNPIFELDNPKDVMKIVNNPNSPLANTGYPVIQVALPTAVNNQSNVRIRLTTAPDPKTNKYTSISNIAYNPEGTIIFDYVQFRATESIAFTGSKVFEEIEKSSNNQFKLSPNLVTGSHLTATHGKAEKGAVITVIDIQTKRTLITQSIALSSTQTLVSVANLPRGQYYIATFLNQGKEATAKFLVQ